MTETTQTTPYLPVAVCGPVRSADKSRHVETRQNFHSTAGSIITQSTPLIPVTDATPPKSILSSRSFDPSISPVSYVSTSGSSYRQLYRGALSLPDSYILLDGLTFSAKLPVNVPSSPYDSPSTSQLSDALARDLIHNPLALALESMRGRPSLRFRGTVRLKDIWMDEAGEGHTSFSNTQQSVLRKYPLSIPSFTISSRKKLHEEDGDRTTLSIQTVQKRRKSSFSVKLLTFFVLRNWQLPRLHQRPPPPLVARVARLTTAPRAPRPDDPTPRKPPARLFGGLTAGALGAGKRIKTLPARSKTSGKTRDHERGDIVCRAKEMMLRLPDSVAFNNSLSGNVSVFKVPEVPQKANGVDTRASVFGPAPCGRSLVGEARAEAIDNNIEADLGDGRSERSGLIEAANKLIIKKSAVRHLTGAGVPRTHPEFKDIFGFLYRGTAFALRADIQTTQLSKHAVDTLVEAHIKLYVMPEGKVADDVFGCLS
ncbi:hypothetical protein EDC04DRAFT_2906421 [Pisolithus marmoratus]|nr:hypothetical protein EDC04DRAFT_2906421 [Pisolithus marmoratus]